jgi:hypothetical protein
VSSYYELLKDPRWQRRRLEIMQRDGFSCLCCGSESKTLSVHHRRYRKGAAPWEYDGGDLVTLCEECHAGYEAVKKDITETLAQITDQLTMRRIAAYAKAARILHYGLRQEVDVSGDCEWMAVADILAHTTSLTRDAKKVVILPIAERLKQLDIDALGTDE